MACNRLSFDDSDVLMTDPYLEYINGILMDEGLDDAAYLQHAHGASHYQAIFSSLQDLIGDDSAVSRPGDVFDPYQSMYRLNQNGPDAYHVQVAIPHDGRIDALHSTTGPVPPSLRGGSAPEDTAARIHHSTTNVNISGVPTDATAASWCGKDVCVEGLRGHVGQEQHGNGAKSKLISADEQVSSNVASELEQSFEDLSLGDVYTSLYVEEPGSSTKAARSRRHDGDRKMSTSRKGRACEKQTSEGPGIHAVEYVKEVLVRCAEAVAIGDVRRGSEILREIHKEYGASEHGNALQRIAYIFSKALVARMRGTGAQEFEAMCLNLPPSAAVLRAARTDFKVSPYKKIMHYFANHNILKAAEGASRLHIVDFGLQYGLHWACLINALADREGGPPLLDITGIEYPELGERLVESGRRLAAYAKTHNVPFQYHAIVSDKWEDVDAASLHCSEGEVLVVNFFVSLRRVRDNSSLPISARQKLLTVVHSLNPHLLVTTVLNAALNATFFVSRFREALLFYSGLLEKLDTLWGDNPERLLVERANYFPQIFNVVACEGAERVERPENFKQWHARITKAAFEQLPIPSTILGRLKSHVKQHYHKDFFTHYDDKGWMLIGWKGRMMAAMSAWRPCHP